MRQTSVRHSLSPLAGLCRLLIRRWLEVVRRGRGGQIDAAGTPWTRLPADELQGQLEREFAVEVSVRSVRRALQELAEAGAVRREQRYSHRWRRDYWYAPTPEEEALEAARPSRIAAATPQAVRSDASCPIERPSAAVQVLSAPSSNSSNLKKGQQAKAHQSPNSRGAARLNEAKGFMPSRGAGLRRLQEAVRRASALGQGGRTPEAAQKAQERLYAEVGGRWVVDDARTAPLR